jgi:methionyl aminopeptidase
MAVTVKTNKEIALMRESNHRLEKVFDELEKMIRPGISTWEIDQAARRLIKEQGGIPNFLNYDGFPAAICTSVNEEVVHGIPKKDRILKEGDIISLDCGLILNGYHSDAARTYPVGQIAKREQKLIEVTKASFYEGIRYARAGHHLHEIGNAIGDYCESRGYGVVRDLVGHGIGRQMHEDPQIPNYRMKSRGLRLVAGMTLAIEPMITEGTWEVDWLDDNWTVVTKDRLCAAHYENTILITDGEPEILSKTHD